MAKLSIHTDEKKSKINRNIYGNFSEHLGRCIYNGIYVGENSDIPNVNGMRTDIVEALKAIKLPVLRWPERRHRPQGDTQKDGQHALGRCCGG